MNIFLPTKLGKARQESVQTIVTRRHNISGAAIVWTDGACEPNPGGPGGWGYRIEHGSDAIEGHGGEASTTNNRMEMLAIIEAIEGAPAGLPLVVRTDSQLCVLCATGRWKRKANLDLWARMQRAVGSRVVVFEWWKGHVGTPGNERADELAAIGRQEAIDRPDPDTIAMLREIAVA
jgi:ribonuclease HI